MFFIDVKEGKLYPTILPNTIITVEIMRLLKFPPCWKYIKPTYTTDNMLIAPNEISQNNIDLIALGNFL